MKKVVTVFCLLLMVFSCQNEEVCFDENLVGNSSKLELTPIEDPDLILLDKDLKQVNADFAKYLAEQPSTRGWGDFLTRSIAIAGADAASMIAAGSGIGSMINVGLITPPGAASFATAVIVCGAAGSIGAAVGVGVVKFSGNVIGASQAVGYSYASPKLPDFEYSGEQQLVPEGYEDLTRMGAWHNDAAAKMLGFKDFVERRPGTSDWEQEWRNTFREVNMVKANQLWSISHYSHKKYTSTQDRYTFILNEYKKLHFISDEVNVVLRNFLTYYPLCKNESEIKELTDRYMGFIWSRHLEFTEAEWQAMIAGFSVAMKSPYFWDEVPGILPSI